jgi:excisionase family DNA binding protein
VPAADPLDAIPREQIPAVIARLFARLAQPDPGTAPSAADDLLTPDEAAKLLRVDRRFLYKHAKDLGAVKLSRRKLRFSRKRLLRYLESHR